MLNLVILVLGDLIVITLQGFYMGVGIRQSAGIWNVAAMTLPTWFVWLGLSLLLRTYNRITGLNLAASQETTAAESGGKRKLFFLRMLEDALSVQRLIRVGTVWLGSSLFAVFWQTWYWNHVLKIDRGISVSFTLFFCLTGFFLLAIWRMVWTLFVMVRTLARKNIVFRVLCYLITFIIVLSQIPPIVLTIRSISQKYTLDDIQELPPYRTAIVFGAGVYRDGRASSILQDRVDTAITLYHAGKVDQILMSGDNSAESRHEVDVMSAIAVEQGVPEASILHDNEGFNTMLTCQNAAANFGIDQAILVTQSFHTTRSLVSCEQTAMQAVAVSADLSVYNIFSWISWYVRDWLGLTMTWLELTLFP